MDHESLRTASTYLNNLLLARGLLRNGDPIDFVKPSKESRAQIINLVHDLILREDRDKEQREHVAHTLRTLRSEDTRKSHEINRLTAKSDESARAAAQAQAAERAAHAEVKKVEKAMKALQEQASKLKTTLAQVKAQCTNDVKKRDLELARLKTHLQGQQRGTRVGMTAPSMSVRKNMAEPSMHDLGDPDYSLRQETTEFLTQLSQSLSDENDNLIGLIRNALSIMKEVLGLPANAKRHPDSAIGSMGSNEEVHGKQRSEDSMLHSLPTSYEALSVDMDVTLNHLKGLLTNPNFVSLEEVEVREEEIARLREGWEHMEVRWRDVLVMMEGWLRKMNTGEAINIDDLRRGMGLVSPHHGRSAEQSQRRSTEESVLDSDTSQLQIPSIDGPSQVTSSSPSCQDVSQSKAKRKRDVLEPPEFFDLRPSTSSNKCAPPSPPKHGSAPRSDFKPPTVGSHSTTMRLEDEPESEMLDVPQMSIAEKLSAAQREAEEATVARAVMRERDGNASRRPRMRERELRDSIDELANEKDEDTLGQMPSPMGKRTKIRGRPRKRKSTLSPEELEALISTES